MMRCSSCQSVEKIWELIQKLPLRQLCKGEFSPVLVLRSRPLGLSVLGCISSLPLLIHFKTLRNLFIPARAPQGALAFLCALLGCIGVAPCIQKQWPLQSCPMSLSSISALSPLDGRYAAKLSALRPIMSEQGYMHRRVQVEITWFIALSDAGFAEFSPLSEGARTYLHSLVSNFSRSRCGSDQGDREDHQPRREGRGILDQGQVRWPP